MAVTKGSKQAPGAHDPAAAGAAERGAAMQQAGEQGLLFGEDLATRPEGIGYRGPTACAAAGITYRQLDYWARTGLVEPSVRAAQGSGSARLYSFRDILVLKVVKRLLDTGISLQQIRAAVTHLRSRGASDLAQVTLMSDGVSVYECTSPDEVVDLLQGGQGVFGIALGRIWQEVDGTPGRAARGAGRRRGGRHRAEPRRTPTSWPGGGPAVPVSPGGRPPGPARRRFAPNAAGGHPPAARPASSARRRVSSE